MDFESESSTSASRRIVVVSSSLETSREVAHRIKALSGDVSAPALASTSESSNSSSEVIHWTIKNKYYTAPVHFHPIHLEGLEFIELDDVPAVIYAWKENEPYRTYMKQVAEQTASYTPEVKLAISLAPTTDEELEDFFFEHGFEYVEGHTEPQDRSAGRFDSSGTPGMHRAVDALSTIMWPSMVRAGQQAPMLGAQSSTSAKSDEEDEVDLDYRVLMNDTGGDGEKANMQRILENFENWLEGDYEEAEATPVRETSGYASLDSHEEHSFSNDPWSMTSPVVPTKAEGFDDDFTEFVSAPDPATSTPSRVESEVQLDEEEDSDSDLPSEADIQATSARIFGPSTGSRSTGPDPSFSSHTESAGTEPAPGQLPNPETETETDSPAFDLTRILSTLNVMKEEISRIPDVRERRREAAKVALGFVYGIEETNSELDAAARLA